MFPTIEVPCRVDYRPVGAKEFSEQVGRVDTLSATGCSIQSRQRPQPGTTLELRVYLPGAPWPIRVQRAQVIWSHWDEFTVEFHGLTVRDQDLLQRCLVEVSVREAA